MFNYICLIISGLLISIATFMSPVKQLAPTSPLTISITITPKATATIIPTPVIIVTQPPQAQKCQFNKEQMTALMRQYGYSEEDIKTFFIMRPGDCFNIKPQTTDEKLNDIQRKLEKTTNCQEEMSQYQDCINENSKAQADYIDCLSSGLRSYCSKPFNKYCFKPFCSY